MPQAFFFVITPLHYLCALEARAHFGDKFKICNLVVVGSYRPTLEQYHQMVRNDGWDTVRYRRRNEHREALGDAKSQIIDTIKARRFVDEVLSDVKEKDFVFAGNIWNPVIRYLLTKCPSREKIILDDGLATVDLLKNRKVHQGRSPKGKTGLVTRVLLPCCLPKLDKLTFYTLYEHLDFTPATKVVNQFGEVRKQFLRSDQPVGNSIAFVGQYLGKADILDQNLYIKEVEAVRDAAIKNGRTFTYFAHRSDTTRLPEHWEVVRGEVPLELLFASMPELPSSVWSFYSSALPNLQVLFDGKVNCHYIQPSPEQIGDAHRATLWAIYTFLRDSQPDLGQVHDLGEDYVPVLF